MDGRTDKAGDHGADWLRAGLDGGTAYRLADGRAAEGGMRAVVRDTVSGAQGRPARQPAALAYLRDGDVLAVWRLDRLGRSPPHLIETMGALDARGVGFRSLSESIDTTTSGGRLIFHVFGALGQFERDLIRERTKAGLAAAAARDERGASPS